MKDSPKVQKKIPVIYTIVVQECLIKDANISHNG